MFQSVTLGNRACGGGITAWQGSPGTKNGVYIADSRVVRVSPPAISLKRSLMFHFLIYSRRMRVQPLSPPKPATSVSIITLKFDRADRCAYHLRRTSVERVCSGCLPSNLHGRQHSTCWVQDVGWTVRPLPVSAPLPSLTSPFFPLDPPVGRSTELLADTTFFAEYGSYGIYPLLVLGGLIRTQHDIS